MFYYIVTIHNKEDLIENVIKGIIKSIKSPKNSKIICVLDGCTDNTEKIIDSITSDVSIIKVYQNDVHELLSLNAAFKYIKNNLNPDKEDLLFLLQDDVVLDEPDFEQLSVNKFKEYPDLGYLSYRVGCSTDIDKGMGVLGEHQFIESEFGHWKQLNLTHFKELKHYEFSFAEIVLKSPTCIKYGLIDQMEYFDENLAPFGHDDLDLCIRLNKLGYKNGIYALKFTSKVDWGGTREQKNAEGVHNKNYNGVVFRNKQYLTKKHQFYYTNKSITKKFLFNDFEKYKKLWKNESRINDQIYNEFSQMVDNIPFLKLHTDFIGKHKMGYGEKPFHYLWLLLFNSLPDKFRFLEIGVYKGSILSLCKLISDYLMKNPEIYGITPLNSSGDKYLVKYDDDDYLNCIGYLYSMFELDISSTTIIEGLSTNPEIKQSILSENKFDVIYIDGSHNYEDVISDILLCKKLLKPKGYLVLDDASYLLNLGKSSQFKGHPDVAYAIRDYLENDINFKSVLTCGHNRIFQNI